MKTEDLIKALAADTAPEPPVERRLAPALALAGVVTLAGFLVALGPRPDLWAALGDPQVLVKHLIWPLLAVGAVGAALAAARPAAGLGSWRLWLGAVAALVGVAVAVELAALPAEAWGMAFFGKSIAACLTSIPLLALPLLAASLYALASGASTRPRLAGALAGLASGALAATVYAFYCNEDSPLFYGTWYTIGVFAVTALGALLGPRLLRW
jgi:hypothetical protein